MRMDEQCITGFYLGTIRCNQVFVATHGVSWSFILIAIEVWSVCVSCFGHECFTSQHSFLQINFSVYEKNASEVVWNFLVKKIAQFVSLF